MVKNNIFIYFCHSSLAGRVLLIAIVIIREEIKR